MALKPINVSQLNKYIGRILRTDPILGNVSVTGEISNLNYHSSGHVYFSLKDQASSVRCFIPSSVVSGLRYRLTDGMEVIIHGYVAVYEKGGSYSLNVRDVEISGQGNLDAAFRALFESLKKEGLFDRERKKPIPAFPKKICVITSPTGAAVRDIIKTIRRRNDYVNVMIYPSLVQGDAAAGELAAAIDDVNRRFRDVDVIITGRGGGSLEELWAFNEEILARSIYASEIPVISAVGHETNYSISDYVADFRAETPTAAAVKATPDTFELRRKLDELYRNIEKRSKGICTNKKELLERYSETMLRSFFDHRIEKSSSRLDRIRSEAVSGMDKRLSLLENRVERSRIMLEAGNPENVVKRGYAIITGPEGSSAVTSVRGIKKDDRLTIRLKDGRISASAEEIREGEQ